MEQTERAESGKPAAKGNCGVRAVIMAGGEGSRLKSVSGDLPKPMVPVLGKPVLQYQIENLRREGILRITLVIGHLGDAIRAYFGDGSAFGVQIDYFCEDHPMGTAGALYLLRESFSGPFLLLMGDLMMDVDFGRFLAFHRRTGALCSLFVHPNAHPYDSDIIVTETVGMLSEYTEERCGRAAYEKRLAAGEETEADADACPGVCAAHTLVRAVLGKKDGRSADYHNQVNAGLYVLSPEALSGIAEPKTKAEIDRALSIAAEAAAARGETLTEAEEKAILKSGKIDLDKDVIRPLIAAGRVHAYRSTEYVKDMGTPDRYEAVGKDLAAGLVAARNLRNRQKCIFLDRDGTINEPNGFVNTPEGFRLLPEAAEAIRRINRSGYLCIVITNQPVIARGECSFETLDRIHAKLETELGKEGAYIDGLYFCPHHRDRGFAGEIPALKFECACRKPAPGLLQLAAKEYHIDLSASVMIGDSPQDVNCGRAAGCRTVLLTGKASDAASASGEGGKCPGAEERAADLQAETVLEAVKVLLPA